MRSFFAAGQTINLPDAGRTPPKVEAAIAGLVQIDADLAAGAIRLDEAEAAHNNAVASEDHRRAASYAATGDYADGDSPVDRLKAEAKQARADYNALRAARDMRARILFDAVNVESEAWAQASRASGKKLILKLTTALRSLEAVAKGLQEDTGVLNMLQGLEDGRGRYSLAWERGSHIFSIDAALEGVRATIAEASAELAARAKTTGVPASVEPQPEHDQPHDEFGPKVRTAEGGEWTAPEAEASPAVRVKVSRRDLADLDDSDDEDDDLDHLIFDDEDEDDEDES
ncbi:hypothetical protein FVP74_09340 [Microbacterium saccharophilum]|uniref:Uncharacterized protein n=1 Tax=Microbacterium saccharophilum TaxID=1213358 RepID=A0A5C8I1U5_9MICO|nr:hypothetical protein [Microbacterium saccharophilum]TXK11522.1 hypothetical protein FVP74_09340 [Microbacterium saccharophilum]GEP49075.1 hypothetical protein MSA03_25830 [Microbacterium saccharophilum]